MKGIFQNISVCFLTLIILVAVYLRPVFAHGGMTGNGHMMPWMMGDWGMGWYGIIFTLLFWIFIILGAIALIRWALQATSGKNRPDTYKSESSRPLEILKERYAKGEITREEFETMKNDLQ